MLIAERSRVLMSRTLRLRCSASALLASTALLGCSNVNKPERSDAISQIRQLVEHEGDLKLYSYFAAINYEYVNGYPVNDHLYTVIASASGVINRSRSEVAEVMRNNPGYFPASQHQRYGVCSDLSMGNVIKENVTCSFLKTENGWLVQPSEACGATKQPE